MIDSHAVAASGPSVSRGKLLQSFHYGSMVPHGMRVSAGGRPADGYVAYEHVKADTLVDLEAIFNNAFVRQFPTSNFIS